MSVTSSTTSLEHQSPRGARGRSCTVFCKDFWTSKKTCSKIIAKNKSKSPWGDPVLFFAMIFEQVFFDAQKSLQKTVQNRPRAPWGSLRRRLGPVSELSWAVLALSWSVLGPVQPNTGPRQSQDSSRQIWEKPKTAPKTPPRRPRSILYCFLQGFLSVEKKVFKNHCKKQVRIALGRSCTVFCNDFWTPQEGLGEPQGPRGSPKRAPESPKTPPREPRRAQWEQVWSTFLVRKPQFYWGKTIGHGKCSIWHKISCDVTHQNPLRCSSKNLHHSHTGAPFWRGRAPRDPRESPREPRSGAKNLSFIEVKL